MHDGKGQKDRTLPMPEVLTTELAAQVERVAALHEQDVAAKTGGVFLPKSLDAKYKNAASVAANGRIYSARFKGVKPVPSRVRQRILDGPVITFLASPISLQLAQLPKLTLFNSDSNLVVKHINPFGWFEAEQAVVQVGVDLDVGEINSCQLAKVVAEFHAA